MINGLRLVSIWSADLNNLLPFYRDTLGLKVAMQTPAFVVLGDPSGPALALGTHSDVRGKAADPYRHIVALDVDDIAAEHRRLQDAGVEFIEEPNRPPGAPVTVATLVDPEGNLLQLQQFHGLA